MDSKRFWIILPITIIIAVILAIIIYQKVIILDEYEYDMYLTVGEVTGINLDTDAIYFGTVRPGDGVTKRIMISSDGRRLARLSAEGDFTEWLSYDDELFIEGDREIQINLKVPGDAQFGKYNGKIKVIILR